VGRRFVPDLAARRCPSYAVELLQPGSRPTLTVITLFPQRLSPELQEWWYSKQPASLEPENLHPQGPPPLLSDEKSAPEGAQKGSEKVKRG
jgi:hypothetical protein